MIDADEARLAQIRVDYPNADTSGNPNAERIRDDVIMLLRLLDEARYSKAAFWEARFIEATGIIDSKNAEIARLRAPAGDDLVERARRAYQVIEAFGWDILWRSSKPIPDDAWPIDIIANFAATIQREARRAAIEEAAQIAHRHCELPAVRAREEGAASRIEDEIRALSSSKPQARSGVEVLSTHLVGAPPQSGWRPIETAPKDGTFILLAGDSGYSLTPTRVHVASWYADTWRLPDDSLFTDDGPAATHWQPLLPLPTEDPSE